MINTAGNLLTLLKKLNSITALAANKLDNLTQLEEIRFRTDRPISLIINGTEFYITEDGGISEIYEKGYITSQQEISSIFMTINENSIYAYQDEIKNGYITIRGGHRIGLAGRVVMNDNSGIKHIKDIASLNVRVSKEIRGCGSKVMPYIRSGIKDYFNTLIVSPPGCGKTTLLRDITRIISDNGANVGIVDERSEIAACYKGVPQNDVGKRTDVLDGCPKALGMIMLLRSMSPQVIVTDEIGGEDDVSAVKSVSNAGVRLITTAHGYCRNNLLDLGKYAVEIVKEGYFQKIIVLDSSMGPGTIKSVIDWSEYNGRLDVV